MCIHIESTTFIDTTNELVPESENERYEPQANLTMLLKT